MQFDKAFKPSKVRKLPLSLAKIVRKKKLNHNQIQEYLQSHPHCIACWDLSPGDLNWSEKIVLSKTFPNGKAAQFCENCGYCTRCLCGEQIMDCAEANRLEKNAFSAMVAKSGFVWTKSAWKPIFQTNL